MPPPSDTAVSGASAHPLERVIDDLTRYIMEQQRLRMEYMLNEAAKERTLNWPIRLTAG